jgi:branched-subunit amino acid ABC-type transport system permease component
MKSLTGFVVRNWEALLPPLVVLVVTVLVGWAVERVVLRWLRHWARKPATDLDDIVISALRALANNLIVVPNSKLAQASSPTTTCPRSAWG